MSKPETSSVIRHHRVSHLVKFLKLHFIAARTSRFDTTWHAFPEVCRSTTIYRILLSQCMRHNHRQPSQVAGDNPACRTRNRTRESRAQNSNALDMTGQPQTQNGPSTGVGPPAQVSAPAPPPASATGLIRRAMMEPSTSVSSTVSSASFVPNPVSEINSTWERIKGRGSERRKRHNSRRLACRKS